MVAPTLPSVIQLTVILNGTVGEGLAPPSTKVRRPFLHCHSECSDSEMKNLLPQRVWLSVPPAFNVRVRSHEILRLRSE